MGPRQPRNTSTLPMARRRFRLRSATERAAALVAAVVVGGFLSGVWLSPGWWLRPTPPPARPPALPAARAHPGYRAPIDAGVVAPVGLAVHVRHGDTPFQL